VVPVVPTVAATKNGSAPAAASAAMAASSAARSSARVASISTSRRFSEPIPAIRAAFSIELCASFEVYAVSRRPSRPRSLPAPPVARSRAASSATSDELEALSSITPPPGPVDRNAAGRPSSSTSQSMTWVSSSVAAGPVAHSMPCTPRPAESSSPRTAGPEELAGK
jgi:hypothetical protein